MPYQPLQGRLSKHLPWTSSGLTFGKWSAAYDDSDCASGYVNAGTSSLDIAILRTGPTKWSGKELYRNRGQLLRHNAPAMLVLRVTLSGRRLFRRWVILGRPLPTTPPIPRMMLKIRRTTAMKKCSRGTGFQLEHTIFRRTHYCSAAMWYRTGTAKASTSSISRPYEPVSNRADCGQEGTIVPLDLRPDVFRYLRSDLDNSTASSLGVIGDETSRIVEQALPEYPGWLPESAPYLSDFAVLNYDFPNDTGLEEYHNLIQAQGDNMPPVNFTETCCATTFGSGPGVYNSGYGPTMKSALINARYIWQFLTIVQATSYDWWTIITFLPCSPTVEGEHCYKEANTTSTFAYDSGLLYIDVDYNKTHDYTIYTTKRAFMVKHFSYFHRPGSVRCDVPQEQLPF